MDFYEEIERLSWSKAIKNSKDVLDGAKLFLNCNPYIIESEKYLDFKKMFEKNDILACDVVLEITERSAVRNYKVFYEHLKRFKSFGFQFAVDDVGGGFASLEAIVETKPEVVKIDGHIVNQLEKDVFKRSLVKFIINFCKENSILSIAECVETKAELDIVKELGVDAVQGYYLYRPTPELNLHEYSMAEKLI